MFVADVYQLLNDYIMARFLLNYSMEITDVYES